MSKKSLEDYIKYDDIEKRVKTTRQLIFFHVFDFLNDNMALRSYLANDKHVFLLISAKNELNALLDKFTGINNFYKPYRYLLSFIDLSNIEDFETVSLSFQNYLSNLRGEDGFNTVFTSDFESNKHLVKEKVNPVSNFFYFK